MARPRTNADLPSTPERILSAAEHEFGERGLAAARLGDIAAAVGIRRPSLLYHFPTKEALYEAVVVSSFAQLGLALRLGRSVEGSFPVQLEAMTRAFARYVDSHPAVARLVVRELLAPDGPGTVVLLGQVAPLLDEVEQWLVKRGRTWLRAEVPVRAAMLQVVSDVLLRSSSGAVRRPLWGDSNEDHTWQLSRILLLRDGGEPC